MPIAGACLTIEPNLLPNATRAYRFGIHEGVDFYQGYSCATIGLGTPVLAAKAGVVIRADFDYTPLSPAELDNLLARSEVQGYTDAEALDRFRGRQVWIDHGNGIVTRYAHLAGLHPDLAVGKAVAAGDIVGFVGNSGTPESVTNPGAEMHLHFEIRIGVGFLGSGLSPLAARALYAQAFGVS
jgi:murein DD-endopeptidase MepM/ murein hydrolase activator NlpD